MDATASMVSVLANNTVMTKAEVVDYFIELLQAIQECESLSERVEPYAARIKAKELDSRRRTFSLPTKQPPTGLAALSPRKRRQYQVWLNAATEREMWLREQEEKETIRLQTVKVELDTLREQQKQDMAAFETAQRKLMDILQRDVLPRAYLKRDIVVCMAKYFIDNRVHTITDAINLYHQEQQWQEMRDRQEQQHRELLSEQRMQALEQQRRQQAQAAQMQQQMAEIQQSADDARFFSELNFWCNL